MMAEHPFDESADQSERDEILSVLAQTIQAIHAQIEAMEWDESPENQELAIKWIRALGYLAGQYRKLMKDTDIDEMESELSLLEAATEVRNE